MGEWYEQEVASAGRGIHGGVTVASSSSSSNGGHGVAVCHERLIRSRESVSRVKSAPILGPTGTTVAKALGRSGSVRAEIDDQFDRAAGYDTLDHVQKVGMTYVQLVECIYFFAEHKIAALLKVDDERSKNKKKR